MKKIKILLVCVLFPVICFCQGVQKDSLGKKLIIRDGISTFSKNDDPLIVLDGKIAPQNLVEFIKPDIIESVNVIKGKEATEIYGIQGQNGAIIIKTKKPYPVSKKKRKILIEGIVTDCEGIKLFYVTISNVQTFESVKSDSLGKFKIKANKNDEIIFSCKNYISQKVKIDSISLVNIKLKQKPSINNGSIILRKPIIYLYPEKETAIDLKFDFVGKVSTTFPKYDKNWSVIAYPDGKIFDTKTKRFYSSLFWDGIFNFPKEHYNYTNGFVVSKNNLTTFLIQKLEFMGLSTSETNEFIQFWLPLMDKNEINLVHFWVNDDYTVFSKNSVNPKPDTSLRIFMEFCEVDENFKIQEQKLFKTERKGFTLVEWGGSDVSTILKTEL